MGRVARDAGRHGERVADRARTQRLAHPFGHDQRTGFRGVDEHRERDDVAEAEHRVALAQRAPRDGAERGERLVVCGGRCGFEAVELPEHDRDRLDLPARGRHHLLEQHGQVSLAEQAGDGVDLPLVGARREVAGQVGVVLLRLGRGGLEVLELPAEAPRLRPGLEQRSVGVGTAHVEEGSDPRGRDTDHRGGKGEHGFVGDDRDDPDRDREHREHCAHRDAAVAVGPEIVVGLSGRGSRVGVSLVHVVPARVARSATISVSRKSLGV